MFKLFLGILLCLSSVSHAKNLHLIDQDKETGFAIYRYGQPTAEEMVEMKKLGITEVMVLSGDATAKGNEGDLKAFKVVYNEKQDEGVPVSKEFLKKFDQWVEDAKDTGKKIAFRCECGCHRTGRLAAYYQMKNQNLTYDDAIAIMNEHGEWMWLWFHQPLYPQVKAMEDYINGRTCSQKEKYCLK